MRFTLIFFLLFFSIVNINANSSLLLFGGGEEEADAEIPLQTTVLNDGNGGTFPLRPLHSSCRLRVDFVVEVANLDLLLENQGHPEGDSLTLGEYPPMHYKYQLGSSEDSGQVTHFKYSHSTRAPNGHLVRIYKAYIRATVDLEGNCTTTTRDRVKFISYFFQINNTPPINSFNPPYPICNYRKTDELFPCFYFHFNTVTSEEDETGSPATPDYCNDELCNNNSASIQAGTIAYTCPEACYSFGTLLRFVPTTPQIDQAKAAINIYPNPFEHMVTINTSETDISSIVMLNNVGHTVYEWQDVSKQGVRYHTIPVEHLPAGVYYIGTMQNGVQNFQRVIKQ